MGSLVNWVKKLGTVLTNGPRPASDAEPVPVGFYDPATGALINPTTPASVLGAEAILSGANGWSVAASGFSNPSYLAAAVNDSTGWSIAGYSETVIAFEGSFSGQVVSHQQTLDPTGLAGWFNVFVVPVINAAASVQSFEGPPANNLSSTGRAYRAETIGVRHRVQITALTGGTAIIGRVKVSNGSMQHMMRTMGLSADGQGAIGDPVPTGLRGVSASGTALSTGNIGYAKATVDRRQVMINDQIPEETWSYPAAASGISNTTTAVTIAGSAGAGLRNYCRGLQMDWGTLGAGGEVAIRDGAGGTVLWRGVVPTAAGNSRITFSPPLRGSVATLMEFVTLTASVSGALYPNAQGYTAP